MGPFGPMDCVNCECKSGRIECHRLECPSRQAMNCDRLVKVAGRCCPVCPMESTGNASGATASVSSSSPVTRDASRSLASHHHHGPPPSAGPSRTTVSRSSAASRGSASTKSGPTSHSLALCLPKDHDVIVYRAQGGGNASEFIQVSGI